MSISDRCRAEWRDPELRARRVAGMRRSWAKGHKPSVVRVIGECYYCAAPATTWDHVVPRSHGGTDDPENVVPACMSCNASKRDRTVVDWMEHLGRIAERGKRAERIRRGLFQRLVAEVTIEELAAEAVG